MKLTTKRKTIRHKVRYGERGEENQQARTDRIVPEENSANCASFNHNNKSKITRS